MRPAGREKRQGANWETGCHLPKYGGLSELNRGHAELLADLRDDGKNTEIEGVRVEKKTKRH